LGQASVLLLFNSLDRLGYSDIKSELILTDDDVVIQLLHSLSSAKYKILNKEPNTTNISPTDYFEFNSKFIDRKSSVGSWINWNFHSSPAQVKAQESQSLGTSQAPSLQDQVSDLRQKDPRPRT
jgi:hypothetical protein